MAAAAGATLSRNELYTLFYRKALEGDPDCGGLVNFNCFSGEPVTGLPDGRPLLVRRPDARFTLTNFARVQLYACLATLKYGLDILFEEEQVTADHLLGHGGLFKVPVVGQKLLAGALGVPVSVMQTAGRKAKRWNSICTAASLRGPSAAPCSPMPGTAADLPRL